MTDQPGQIQGEPAPPLYSPMAMPPSMYFPPLMYPAPVMYPSSMGYPQAVPFSPRSKEKPVPIGSEVVVNEVAEKEIEMETNDLPETEPEYQKPILAVEQPFAFPQGADGAIDIITLINNIFIRAKQERASDIHIEPTEDSIQVRFRVDGEFHEYYRYPLDYKQALLTRMMILAGLKLDETRLPQDGKIVIIIQNMELDMRVSTFPSMYGNKVVIRLLEKDAQAKTLEELGYAGKELILMKKNLHRTYGMILMTGPTGSGKSTTLFSMLSSYNPFQFNISTLEDPIEYVIKGANQAQIHADIGFDFADGLRSLVRQDPDIIMIGEIRDKISANLAVQAALTGHLVFSTVHANTASATIQRLANMEVDPFLAASALNLIVSQRLIRRICAQCRTAYTPPLSSIKSIEHIISKEELSQIQFFKGQGCDACRQTGYKGRVAISEVLPITPAIQKAIIANPIASFVEEQAIKQGMKTIKHNGIEAVKQGLTTLEEVLVAVDIS
jgi:type IV pilus assembly protein PilB